MEKIKIRGVSFKYSENAAFTLRNISLTVEKGSFVAVCGKSGCGKTTLLRLLKPSITPYGNVEGSILFEGKEITQLNQREEAEKIGFVFQSPDNQIVTDKVWHELSFGLESLGLKTPEIRARVSEMASFFGIDTWFHKKVTELSGGQKQLLNLAAVMVMQPSLLILDEPASQLDPIAAYEFLKTLEKINRELGTTVIISEHRLEDVFSVADRVIVMEDGKIIADDSPVKVSEMLCKSENEMMEALPPQMRVFDALGGEGAFPLTIREGRKWLEKYSENHMPDENLIPTGKNEDASKEKVIEVKDVFFRYEKNSPDIIKNLSFYVRKGEIFAIVGGNGTGKTTALNLLAGINSCHRGKVLINGKDVSQKNTDTIITGVLPQNPQAVFVNDTLHDDLMEALTDGLTCEKEKEVEKMAKLCQLGKLMRSHPYDLSGGEQQRAALCKVLLRKPEILLLDEPTKGFDAGFKKVFADILKELTKSGMTVVIVSHDIEFCAEFADRCAMFFDGSIASVGTAREFFSGKSFYTTAANRMARNVISKAVLTDDIIRAFGKKTRERKKENFADDYYKGSIGGKSEEVNISHPIKSGGRNLIASLSVLITVPLTIYFGTAFFEGRKYLFISLMVLLEVMIPFLMAFERKKPKARELVTISVLCAIAVAGRVMFYMLPQVKPIMAVVIITGIAFGSETGFLSGAVSGFVSNFFFGQGPWTPWQMFSLGISGFISGVVSENGIPIKKKTPLALFGFFLTLVLYGIIMNVAAVVMASENPSWELFKASFTVGFPLDLIHALSTALFLWFISEPMLKKIERVKIKYGLMR